MSGTLFLVATPIGNLEDITHRALAVLRQVSVIACEDTRHSKRLLDHYGISRELVSLPAFDEASRAGSIVNRLVRGEDVALITDAGSPGVSDPGERLVALAIEAGARVVPVPGATALIAALTASGLSSGRFHFLGFLPRGEKDRAQVLEEVKVLRATLVFYESPRRVGDTLAALHQALGDRRACVARELTKVHEELVRGRLSELIPKYRETDILGEVVLVVEGRVGEERWTSEQVVQALEEGLGRGEKLKTVANEVAERAGWPSKEVYRLGLDLGGRGRR